MQESYLTYLNGPDIAGLNMSDAEILAAVEESLRAQGLGQTRIEPRVHLVPEDSAKGHFNVLRGYIQPCMWRASRLSATMWITTSTACPRKWR